MINSLNYDEPHMLSEELTSYYRNNIKARIHGIEDAIDIHLNLIGGLHRFL